MISPDELEQYLQQRAEQEVPSVQVVDPGKYPTPSPRASTQPQ